MKQFSFYLLAEFSLLSMTFFLAVIFWFQRNHQDVVFFCFFAFKLNFMKAWSCRWTKCRFQRLNFQRPEYKCLKLCSATCKYFLSLPFEIILQNQVYFPIQVEWFICVCLRIYKLYYAATAELSNECFKLQITSYLRWNVYGKISLKKSCHTHIEDRQPPRHIHQTQTFSVFIENWSGIDGGAVCARWCGFFNIIMRMNLNRKSY